MLDMSFVGDGVIGGVEGDFFFRKELDCFLGVALPLPLSLPVTMSVFLNRFFMVIVIGPWYNLYLQVMCLVSCRYGSSLLSSRR